MLPRTHPSRRTLTALAAAAAVLVGCPNAIRSTDVLKYLSTPTSETPPFPALDDVVALVVRQTLPDAYWDAETAVRLVAQPGFPAAFAQAEDCAHRAFTVADEDSCLAALSSAISLPPPPPLPPDAASWKREQDLVRLSVNLSQAVRSVVAYHRTAHVGLRDAEAIRHEAQDLPAIAAGADRGGRAFAAYQRARPVRRDESRPTVAMVFSGGAAGGAFSAGAAWWILTRLDACQRSGGCSADRIDMVAGASTGALIGVLVKDFFAGDAARRQRALDELVDGYTCSVPSELFCVTDTGLGDLLLDPHGKAQGMVRFTGVADRLNRTVDATAFRSGPESFASTVDFVSGRVVHFSSADPADIPDLLALKQSILASIVEPALAEPVPAVGSLRGQWLDGGVRSGLPLLSPLLRGAERALVFVNSPLEPRPLRQPLPNAGRIAFRMLDLFSSQPVIGELHEAEARLAVKREEEYQRCLERLGAGPELASRVAAGSPGPGARLDELERLCSGRESPGKGAAPAPLQAQIPQPSLPASRQYRAAWIFEPTVLPSELQQLEPSASWENLGTAGYGFDPPTMWRLFVLGAVVAQARCPEIDSTAEWHLQASGSCGSVDDLARALAPLRDRARRQCWTKDASTLRVCGKAETIQLTP